MFNALPRHLSYPLLFGYGFASDVLIDWDLSRSPSLTPIWQPWSGNINEFLNLHQKPVDMHLFEQTVGTTGHFPRDVNADVEDCSFYLHSHTEPIIEASKVQTI